MSMKHVATVALYGMAGNRIGTGYIYDAVDYLERRQFMAERGKPFSIRWRNEECRLATLKEISRLTGQRS